MHTQFRQPAVTLAFSILVAACSSGSGGTGGSGSDGGSGQGVLDCPQGTHQVGNECVQNAPSMLSQANVDADTATTIVNGMADIYNQNLAGKPTGSVNVTVNCPVGGTAHITGTTSYDSTHGITSVMLTIAMTGCKMSEVSASSGVNVALSLDGSISETGSWNSSNYASVNYQATGVVMSGTDQRTGYAQATIGQTCDVALTFDESGSTNTVSGTICGRPAS